MRAALIGIIALTALPAGAQARPFQFAADSSTYPGRIVLFTQGEPGVAVSLAEVTGGRRRVLAQQPFDQYGLAVRADVARWQCSPLTRVFEAKTASASATFSVRTPSCRRRLTIEAPARVRPGATVKVELRDSFELGGVRARLCVSAPARRARCRSITVGRSRRVVSLRMRARGRWKVGVRTRYQRSSSIVAVGVRAPHSAGRDLPRVVLTGDSLMQGIDNVVKDRLLGRVRVFSYTRPGSGLSKPGFDFVASTRRLARRLRPAATVVFLGANDGFDLGGSPCCGEPWVAAYAERARGMMRAGGRRTLWLSLPAPRDERLRNIWSAINAALVRADAAEGRARLLDLGPVFSPGFVYSPYANHLGRRVRVRESDGVHLNVEGARIAAALAIRELERYGAIPKRLR